jgi:pimeloyl-ACP methyl ester carboxylesterase
MRETEIDRGGRVLRVRDAGDPGGNAVMYFHGTPGSRLDLCFGEQLAADRGVRLVSFDRPGYGGSSPAPFGLASVAADAHGVADGLGLARFATLGMSGGGPGALAVAAVAGGRVSRAGIASGAGPFQLVPGALDDLDDNDRAAMSLLPGDPPAAAAAFAACWARIFDRGAGLLVLVAAGSLSCSNLVLVRQAAEDLFSADLVLGEVYLRRAAVCLSRCQLVKRTMRSGGVVVLQVLGQYLSQVVLADDQKPVEDLAAQGADHPFADGIAPHRQLHPIRTIGTVASG